MQFLLLTIYTHHPRDLISLSLYFLSTCNAPLFLHIVLIFILTYIFHFTVVCLYYLAPLSFCFAGFSLPSSLSFTICSVFYYLLCLLLSSLFFDCRCILALQLFCFISCICFSFTLQIYRKWYLLPFRLKLASVLLHGLLTDKDRDMRMCKHCKKAFVASRKENEFSAKSARTSLMFTN